MRGHTWQDWHDQQGRNADSEAAEVRRSHAKTLADLEAMLECEGRVIDVLARLGCADVGRETKLKFTTSDMIEFADEIEKEFGVYVPDEVLAGFVRVGDAVDFVADELA